MQRILVSVRNITSHKAATAFSSCTRRCKSPHSKSRTSHIELQARCSSVPDRSLVLTFPSFYYVPKSFVFRLRQCRSTSLEAIISLYKRPSSSESRCLLCHRRFSVGCCRYPRFWVPWPSREDSWSHTPYAAPHLPSFTKSNSAFEPVLVSIKSASVMLRFYNRLRTTGGSKLFFRLFAPSHGLTFLLIIVSRYTSLNQDRFALLMSLPATKVHQQLACH